MALLANMTPTRETYCTTCAAFLTTDKALTIGVARLSADGLTDVNDYDLTDDTESIICDLCDTECNPMNAQDLARDINIDLRETARLTFRLAAVTVYVAAGHSGKDTVEILDHSGWIHHTVSDVSDLLEIITTLAYNNGTYVGVADKEWANIDALALIMAETAKNSY